MLEEIKKIAKTTYAENDYRYHILPVVKNALLLSDKLHADRKVVETAAYLHDIGRAVERIEYKRDNDHHIIGAEKSTKILAGLGCDEEFIRKVYHCILSHRGRKGPDPETLEAEIVNCADAMAHIDTFLDLFLFINESNPLKESVSIAKAKMIRAWNKKLTLDEAKEIVSEKFNAVMLLLDSMEEYID